MKEKKNKNSHHTTQHKFQKSFEHTNKPKTQKQTQTTHTHPYPHPHQNSYTHTTAKNNNNQNTKSTPETEKQKPNNIPGQSNQRMYLDLSQNQYSNRVKNCRPLKQSKNSSMFNQQEIGTQTHNNIKS